MNNHLGQKCGGKNLLEDSDHKRLMESYQETLSSRVHVFSVEVRAFPHAQCNERWTGTKQLSRTRSGDYLNILAHRGANIQQQPFTPTPKLI